jgi:hypothetical protein
MNRSIAMAAALAAACSGASRGGETPVSAPPSSSSAAGSDACESAVDKLFGLLARRGAAPDPGLRDGAVADCRTRPDDPIFACVNGAADDAAVEACMTAPKGEPFDELARVVENLRTYFFVHETFTVERVPLTPAQACCRFPDQRCPSQAPDPILTDLLELDLSTPRRFQYGYESTGTKAVIEAVGDRDCDGVTVTYRREVEHRADGNMHITVIDPPARED